MLLVEIAALAIAVWALRRSRSAEGLDARVRALEAQLQLLRMEMRQLPPAAGVPGVEVVAAEPVYTVMPSATPASEPPPIVPSLDDVAEPVIGAPSTPPPRPVPPPLPPMPRRPLAPAPPPRPAAPSLASQIDWERWIGVRGAAVLGGVVLALAGIFLFRYSIEHDLIPPWVRVAAGVSAGVACILAAERFLRREYAGTADAVEGGGVVILYASIWAARVLYGLIGMPSAFVLMISITAVCCALSWRHASLLISLLGLSGGFATPFLLDSGADNPIGLFAYVFLLDAALLYLAEKRGWPLLSVLSLAATTLYQASWILFRMGPSRTSTGLVLLALSGALFGIASRFSRDGEKTEWRWAQAGGLLVPVLFVLYFSVDRALSPNLLPLALLIGIIDIGACWLAAVQKRPSLGLSAAAGSVAVVAVWMNAHTLAGSMWELAAVSIGLALIFHLAVEWEREPAGADGPAPAAMIAAIGLFWILVAGAAQQRGPDALPWLVTWACLTAILVRHGGFANRGWLQLVAWALFALGLASSYGVVAPLEMAGLWVLLGVAAQAVALLRKQETARWWAEHAAALFAAAGLLNLPREIGVHGDLALALCIAGVALGLLVALASARLARGHWLLAAVLLTGVSQSAVYVQLPAEMLGDAALLAVAMASVLVFAAFPFVVGRRFAGDAWAWSAAALAGPAWFVLLHQLYVHLWSRGTIGLLPVALGTIAAAQGWWARSLWDEASLARRRNLAWFFVVAIGFITLAIPLQLEKEWITVAWALEGVGVLLLWRRLDVPWLKYFAMALLVAITIRLVANPAVLGYYPRPSWRIVNWLLYLYMIPAAALLAGARILRELEVARAQPWEGWYAGGRPLGAVALGFAGGLVIFVWINLAIADWFSTGPDLQVSLERLPARDLSMSIAWAVYALGLLTVGVRLRSVGVRWGSLALMIITIAKVFLYDLGELRDLYRVASLLGLALSLIAVSLAYQRFVLVRPQPVEEMKRFASMAVVLLSGAFASHVFAAPKDLSSLLEYEADIIVPAGEMNGTLQRLVLPPQVMAAARADLSDVRVFDADGAEVPFVVDSGLRSGEVRRVVEVVAAKVLAVRRQRIDRDDGPSIFREEYDLEAPPASEIGSGWEIDLAVAEPQFVRTIEVVPLGANGEEGAARRGTLYRLPSTRATRTSIGLPESDGSRLRLVIEGTEGNFLEPVIRFRRVTTFDHGERLVLPLEILAQRKQNELTLVDVARPAGVVPDVVRVESDTEAYYRPVTIYDVGGPSSTRVGQATVFRVQVRTAIAESDVPLSPAHGSVLRLAIVDEDSASLTGLKVSAVVRQPVLYFSLPRRDGASAGKLRYGGGRVDRARYDLQNLSPAQSVIRGELARVAEAILARGDERPVELRNLRRNPKFDPAPLLAYAMHPGAPVASETFSHRRSVAVIPSVDGLTRIRLGARDLAVARPDLGDVRVVGSDGRQWPYLLQRGAGTEWVAVPVSPPVLKRKTSRYDLTLPIQPLAASSLELTIDLPFFGRPFRLVDQDGHVLATDRLARGERDVRPLVVDLPGGRLERLSLVVEDGDEAPLPIVAARVAVPVADLFVTAPAGEYALLIGDAGAVAPRYDLADAREAVLSVRSNEATPAPLEANPTHGWKQKLFAGGGTGMLQRTALWAVLAGAVAALALVTIRLVRREGEI